MDPKYYWYHKLISYPLEKCIALKEHIIAMDEKIILDLDETTKALCKHYAYF